MTDPAPHVALGIGRQAGVLTKVGRLMHVEVVHIGGVPGADRRSQGAVS